jgi:hypothetical protein
MSHETFPLFTLSRDGHEVMTGSEFAILDYIHNHHSCSFSWACQHEGYSVEPAS